MHSWLKLLKKERVLAKLKRVYECVYTYVDDANDEAKFPTKLRIRN